MEKAIKKKSSLEEVETSTTAKNIKKYRKIKGYTQKSLAAALGLSESTIQKYESGAVSPTFSTLFKLADVLDINAEELITIPSSNHTDEISWIEKEKIQESFLDLLKVMGYQITYKPSVPYKIPLSELPKEVLKSIDPEYLKLGYTLSARDIYNLTKDGNHFVFETDVLEDIIDKITELIRCIIAIKDTSKR